LTTLAVAKNCFDSGVLGRIKALGNDPVPAVRYQISTHIANLYRNAPNEMWALLEQFARQELSAGVLQGLGWSLNRLSGPHGDSVSKIVETIFNRMTDGQGADAVRNMCINLMAGLYVWQNQPSARNVLTSIIADPISYAGEIQNLLHAIGGWLAAKRQDGS